MYSGIHAPNRPITGAAADLLFQSGITACKLMWYHGETDVSFLKSAGVTKLMMRLPNGDRPNVKTEKREIPSFFDYAMECMNYIVPAYSRGVRDFQLGNEPNQMEAWATYTPAEGQTVPEAAAWFYSQAAGVIKSLTTSMKGLRLGLAPISFDTDHNPYEWVAEFAKRAGAFDFVCCNSYWQSETGNSMLWGQFGGNAAYLRRLMPTVPIVVTEYGNSLAGRTSPPAPSQATVERCMVNQYPIWLNWARMQGYIEAAYCFILDPTPDWLGFAVTPPVAHAIGTALPVAEESRRVAGRFEL